MLKHIAAASVAAVVVGYAVPSIADSKPTNTVADSAPTQPTTVPSTTAPAEAGKAPEMSKPMSAPEATPIGSPTVQNPTESTTPTTTPASPSSTETTPGSMTPASPSSTEATPASPSSTPASPTTTPASPSPTEATPASPSSTPDATTTPASPSTPVTPAPDSTTTPATPTTPPAESSKPAGESSGAKATTMVLEKETITGVKEVALPTPPVTPAFFTLPMQVEVVKEAAITSDTPITDKLAKDIPSWGAAVSACLRDKPAFVRVVGDQQVPFVVGDGEGKVRLNANNKPVCTASL